MTLDPKHLLEAGGYVALFGIVYAESGLLIGFFLPGDSLLFTAGFLASQGLMDITAVILVVVSAAILGDSTGYTFGRRLGPRVFKRPDSRVFNVEHLRRSQAFYERHGGKTLILARFTPIVRTFAPILAGVGKMPYRKFVGYNVAGAIIWGISLPLLGYFLGKSIPNIDRYLLPAILIVVLLSISPAIIHLLRHSRERRRVINWLKSRLPGQK